MLTAGEAASRSRMLKGSLVALSDILHALGTSSVLNCGKTAFVEHAGKVEELLVEQGEPDSQLRVPQWQEFERQQHKVNRCHSAAHCRACIAHEVSPLDDVRGTSDGMDSHLAACPHVPRKVKEAAAARIRERADTKKQKQAQKRPQPSQGSAADTPLAKKQKQSGFCTVSVQDKSHSEAESREFEQLLLNAVVSANWPLQSVSNPQVKKLFNYLRPAVNLPGRNLLSGRVLQDRIEKLNTSEKKVLAAALGGFEVRLSSLKGGGQLPASRAEVALCDTSLLRV